VLPPTALFRDEWK